MEYSRKATQILQTLVSVMLAVLVYYYSYERFAIQSKYSILFLSLCIIFISLNILERHEKDVSFLARLIRGKWNTLLALSSIALALVIGFYLYTNFLAISDRMAANTNIDYVISALAILIVALFTWKSSGLSLFILIVFFLFYAFFGRLFPGLLNHGGLTIQRILETQVLGFGGIYGMVLQIIGTIVALFVLYASLLQGFGVMEILLKLISTLSRKFRYGLIEFPIITSLIFGAFSGSSGANAAATGSFTIPLLKRFGIPGYYAAAAEAAASSGGQVMPPIMGASAFLMSQLLGISYLKVMTIAFVPALIYYASLSFAAYVALRRYIMPYSQRVMSPDHYEITEKLTRADMIALIPMVISLGVLLGLLVYTRGSVFISAFYGISTLLITTFVQRLLTLTWKNLKSLQDFARQILDGIIVFARLIVPIGILGGGMGLIIRVLTTTALAPKLTIYLTSTAGDSIILLVILTLALSILFGMAISTIVVYLLVVILIGPAFSAFGIEPIVAHFLVLYMGLFAMLSPPVAPVVVITSGIAKSKFWRTALEAVRFGCPMLLLPLSFVNYPELVVLSRKSIVAVPLVLIGIANILYSIYGNIRREALINNLARICYLLAGLFILFYPVRSLCIITALVMLGLSTMLYFFDKRLVHHQNHLS